MRYKQKEEESGEKEYQQREEKEFVEKLEP